MGHLAHRTGQSTVVPDGDWIAWEAPSHGPASLPQVWIAAADRLDRPQRIDVGLQGCRPSISEPAWHPTDAVLVAVFRCGLGPGGLWYLHPPLSFNPLFATPTPADAPRFQGMADDALLGFTDATTLMIYDPATGGIAPRFDGLPRDAAYDLASDGTLWFDGAGPDGLDVTWVDPDGTPRIVTDGQRHAVRPHAVSGGVLVAARDDTGWSIVRIGPQTTATLATSVALPTRGIGLSADRGHLAWVAEGGGLWVAALDGSAVSIPLPSAIPADPDLWIGNGRTWVAYVATDTARVEVADITAWLSAPGSP